MNSSESIYSKTNESSISCGAVSDCPFAGIDPRKGWRTPLDKNRYSEQRNEETGLSYFGASYSTSFRDVSWQRPQASLGALLLKRYYDAELTTGWLSVDPMADKHPGMSPYNYCAGNPVRLVVPDGRDTILSMILRDGNTHYWSNLGDSVCVTD